MTGIYANPWPHILTMVTSTVLYTLLYIGARGSVLLAMVVHAGWNLAPEVVLLPSFAGADFERAFTLYLISASVVSVLATVLAWPRLTGARPAEII